VAACREVPGSADIMKNTVKGFNRIIEKIRKMHIKESVRKAQKSSIPFTVAPDTVDLKIRSPKHAIQNRIKSFRAILYLLFIPVTHSFCSLPSTIYNYSCNYFKLIISKISFEQKMPSHKKF
jgi:hypothetical protein